MIEIKNIDLDDIILTSQVLDATSQHNIEILLYSIKNN